MPRDLNSDRYARLRKGIVDARKSAALSQTMVATKLNRPQSYVADIERAERRIDIIEYLALADAIGFDPLDMLQKVLADPTRVGN